VTAAELRVLQRRGAVALASRETRRVLSLWTQTILPPAVTALLFLAVFGGALGPRIGDVEGVDYGAFVLPGLLVLTVVGPAVGNSSTSLYQAKAEGYLDDILTSPLRAWQIAAAFVAGSLVRAWAAALLVALAAIPFTGGVDEPALAVLALVLAGFLFASLGVVVGVWAETFDQHALVTNLVVTPLALLAGVFYSVRALEEPWGTVTRIDPLYYLVDATRHGFTGSGEASTGVALAVTALAGVAVFALAGALVERGWRLKP
jgi:ABC-2 type transport system permease protein